MKTPTTLTDADIDRLYVAPARYRGRMTKKIGQPANNADRLLELQYVAHLKETAEEAALEPMRDLADIYISVCAELSRIPRIDERPAYNVLWNDDYTAGIMERLRVASRMMIDDHEAIRQHTRPLPATVQGALNALDCEAASAWFTGNGRLFLYSTSASDHRFEAWTGPHEVEEVVTTLRALNERLEKEAAEEEAESVAFKERAKALAKAAGIKAFRVDPVGYDDDEGIEVSVDDEWSQRMAFTMTDAQALVDDGDATDLTDALRQMGVENVRVSPVVDGEDDDTTAVLDRLETLHASPDPQS